MQGIERKMCGAYGVDGSLESLVDDELDRGRGDGVLVVKSE